MPVKKITHVKSLAECTGMSQLNLAISECSSKLKSSQIGLTSETIFANIISLIALSSSECQKLMLQSIDGRPFWKPNNLNDFKRKNLSHSSCAASSSYASCWSSSKRSISAPSMQGSLTRSLVLSVKSLGARQSRTRQIRRVLRPL